MYLGNLNETIKQLNEQFAGKIPLPLLRKGIRAAGIRHDRFYGLTSKYKGNGELRETAKEEVNDN